MIQRAQPRATENHPLGREVGLIQGPVPNFRVEGATNITGAGFDFRAAMDQCCEYSLNAGDL